MSFSFYMSKARGVLAIFLFLPFLVSAQKGVISGIVSADSIPISGVKIFLNNSSYSAISDRLGAFTIRDLAPGSYELVAVAKGYSQYTKTISVSDQSVKLNIELSKNAIQLNVVTISGLTKSEWNKYFNQFKAELIGDDENSFYCSIINPEVVNINYHKRENVIDVSTDEFLIIDNKALGLRVKFLIKSFKMNLNFTTTTYLGNMLFEDIDTNDMVKARWTENRAKAYFGSPIHFYRSLSRNELESDGFEIYEIKRNSKKNITKISSLEMFDLYGQIQNKNRLSGKDLMKPTDQPGIFSLTFANCLFVIYKSKIKDFRPNVYPPSNYEFSVISNVDNEPKTIFSFDSNGVVIGSPPFYQGRWSENRLSNMLPFNYVPGKYPK